MKKSIEIIGKNRKALNLCLIIANLAVLAILGFVRGKKGNVEIHTSIWCGDPEGDAKAAEIMAASMNKK